MEAESKPSIIGSNESSSDELRESRVGTYRVRRKASLLNRWKRSGLALRRYLYCLEGKKSDSSSFEEDSDKIPLDKGSNCVSEVSTDHAEDTSHDILPDLGCLAPLNRKTTPDQEVKTCSINRNCNVNGSDHPSKCFCTTHSSSNQDIVNNTHGNCRRKQNICEFKTSSNDIRKEIAEESLKLCPKNDKDVNICKSESENNISHGDTDKKYLIKSSPSARNQSTGVDTENRALLSQGVCSCMFNLVHDKKANYNYPNILNFDIMDIEQSDLDKHNHYLDSDKHNHDSDQHHDLYSDEHNNDSDQHYHDLYSDKHNYDLDRDKHNRDSDLDKNMSSKTKCVGCYHVTCPSDDKGNNFVEHSRNDCLYVTGEMENNHLCGNCDKSRNCLEKPHTCICSIFSPFEQPLNQYYETQEVTYQPITEGSCISVSIPRNDKHDEKLNNLKCDQQHRYNRENHDSDSDQQHRYNRENHDSNSDQSDQSLDDRENCFLGESDCLSCYIKYNISKELYNDSTPRKQVDPNCDLCSGHMTKSVLDSKSPESENLHWDECNLYDHDDQLILGSCDYHDKHACKGDTTANQPTLKIHVRKGDNLKSTQIDPTKEDNHISDGSIQIEKSDVNSDRRGPSREDHCNFLSLSSDSGMTDSSSICDWADGSSEAILECYDNVFSAKSPKRHRKSLKSRIRSHDDEDFCGILPPGLDVSEGIDHLETLLDYSPTGFLSSLAKIRLGSQLSEESTESETLSTGNPVLEDTDTTDSIPGLNYAMPYLSDKLKTSLAQRIGVCNFVHNDETIKEEVKDQNDEKSRQDHKQSNENGQEANQGRELLSNEASSGEYMTDERTLSDMLFNLDKIDMIDRIFLREDHSQDLGRISNLDVPFHTSDRHHNHVQTEETDTVSDGGEADDEFECDCQFCVGSRLNQGRNEVDGDEDLDQTGSDIVNLDGATANTSDDDRLNMWITERDDDESLFTINIEELSPLDLLMNNRRSELEIMFENVILQMLAVHPDLLSDQAPPPASSSIIQNLASSSVTSLITSQHLSCPICLCLYVEADSITTLSCQHNFHPLCIQAWLKQSGTCPVCRFVL